MNVFQKERALPRSFIRNHIQLPLQKDLPIISLQGLRPNLVDQFHLVIKMTKIGINASALPGGVYFYRISAGEYTDIKKMILLR